MKRPTELRADAFCFVTDNEDKESVDDNEQSQVKLFQSVRIKNAEYRTQKKLTDNEIDVLTNNIIKLVESQIKPY